jgi:hypothetical protein
VLLTNYSLLATERCQIVSTSINNTKYFVIDTPGFNDEHDEWEIFCDIVDILDQIRGHAVISGVWFVVNNLTPRRSRGFDGRLYTWLAQFCGDGFFPHLTFVTTFWEAHDESQLQSHNTRLRGRMGQEWASFLSHGARSHQFGKRYVNGVEIEETLSWHTDTGELSAQAREMVTLYCQDAPTIEPRILQQLNENTPRDFTTAAQVFRPARPEVDHGEEPSTSEYEASQESPSHTASGQPRRPEAEAPSGCGPPPTAHRPDEQSPLWDVASAIGRFVGDIIKEAVMQKLQGNNGRNQTLQNMGTRGLDRHSVQDTCKAFNIPWDFDSRMGYFSQFGGSGHYTGSSEQNDWLRRELQRRSGS